MSLRRFLNVAYAILIEEYQRLGTDLISAMAKIAELAESTPSPTGPRPVPKAVAASNEASMALLQGMLGNVQNSPTKRKPRKTK